MGCTSSKSPPGGPPKKRTIPGGLGAEDIEKRRISKEGSTTTADLAIDFAVLTQRGYYPSTPTKPNQDAYLAIPQLNGDENVSLFAVFDGHGAVGHTCARFTAGKLPENLKEATDKGMDWPTALTTAFEKTNLDLRESQVNDEHSGTTCCALVFVGGTCYIANVGDSRAVVARKRLIDSPHARSNGDSTSYDSPPDADSSRLRTCDLSAEAMGDTAERLIAKPLSCDQTPFRKDERDRVKLAGARVLTAQQLSGSKRKTEEFDEPGENEFDTEGDPPRIWLKSKASPGTAFSRSFGDAEAESVGVYATPEIEVREVRQDDTYIVIASDGVFEFLTNQNVVDIVQGYGDSSLEACRSVVLEAYAQWMTWDTRSDDITMILLKVGGGQEEALPVDLEFSQGVKAASEGGSVRRRAGSLYGGSAADHLDEEEEALPRI
jgi:serine/threonine protein phosphatase PrpC